MDLDAGMLMPCLPFEQRQWAGMVAVKSQRSLPIAIDREEDLAVIGMAGVHAQKPRFLLFSP